MRLAAALLVLAVVAFLVASPAAASCAPPATVAENASRTTAVVYGTVTDASGGAVTVRVDRVLKGQVGSTVRAFVGPGRGGGAGAPIATSVDYTAAVGSDHVLYLMRAADGQLETNACSGSHSGPPSPDEVAYFGAGTPPSGGLTPAPVTVPEAPVPIAQVSLIWALLVIAVVGGAALLVTRRRAT